MSGSGSIWKQECRNNVGAVGAFVAEKLIKSSDSADRLKFSEAYRHYPSFCETEGRKGTEDKKSFKKVLKDLGFKIGNSNGPAFLLHVSSIHNHQL
jgi:hypothetical protein